MIDGKQPGAPRVVFTDETDVYLGGKQVQMRYFGRGHTNGDAMVYFPALRVLHTGDLMAGTSPLIDYGGGGSLKEWAATLDKAMKLDFDTDDSRPRPDREEGRHAHLPQQCREAAHRGDRHAPPEEEPGRDRQGGARTSTDGRPPACNSSAASTGCWPS